MCGMEGEGLPDILFMADDGVAIESEEDFAGHGFVVLLTVWHVSFAMIWR